MLGILSTIMTLYGVGMAGACAGAGAKSLVSSMETAGEIDEYELIPIEDEYRWSKDRISFATSITHNKTTGEYSTEVTCFKEKYPTWLRARSEEELMDKLKKQYERNTYFYGHRDIC